MTKERLAYVSITGSVSTAHAAALEVFLGVQALHLVSEAETSTQLAGLVL